MPGLNVLHAFSYKADGELLSANDLGSDFAYAYDGLGRVTQVDNDGTPGVPRVVLDMTYDANGNRTMAGYDTGDNNQLLEDGTYAYEYDDEGNRTLRTNLTTEESTEYVWDCRNRLVQTTDKDDL